MQRQLDIAGIYPRYGTKNCYDCGAEPVDSTPFWERFVELHGERYSIPCCDTCLDIALSPGEKAATE